MPETYTSRTFLGKEGTASTSNVVFYSGPPAWKSDNPEQHVQFVSISDCHQSVRLHRTDQESMEDWLNKLRVLRAQLDAYITFEALNMDRVDKFAV